MKKQTHSPAHGFTLVEVLVSLVILSVMAATAFKGMDAISRAREVAEGKLKRTLRLQSVMTQFEADMASFIELPSLLSGSFNFDGARLRFTRQSPGGTQGVQVVVWNFRNGQLERWAGPYTTTVGEAEKQWKQSFQLQGNEAGTLVALRGVQEFQAYYWIGAGRSGSSGWSNAQSTGNMSQPTGGRALAPQGIKIVLNLGPGSGFEGVATRAVILGAH